MRFLILLAFSVLALRGSTSIAAAPAQASDTTAFLGARIIDGTGRPPVEEAALVVSEGRVLEVGPVGEVGIPDGANEIDLTGKTIMPGIFNAHGHTNQDPGAVLQLFAKYGVTTVVTLGDDTPRLQALHDQQDSAELDRARLFYAGQVSGSPAQAMDRVDALASTSADWVKIRLDRGQGASDPGYRDVVARAHAGGL